MTIPHSRAAMVAIAATSALALSAPALHAAPAAHAAGATKCDISKVATTLGPTEVTSLKVTKVSCKNGISVVRAFHKCRLAHGTSGRCVTLVKGYACNEIRQNAGPQFTSKVTCKKKKKTVVHNYTQVV
jgi:hypothetical protein